MTPTLRAATISLFLALAGACALTAPALAADGETTRLDLQEAPASSAGQAGASGGGLARTIVGLAVVIGVIYGITWVLRQVKRSREEAHSGSGLSTLATLPLGPNRSLHLVRAGDEVVLLGAGEGGVTAIRTYRHEEAEALGLVADDRSVLGGAMPDAPPQQAGLLAAVRRRTVIK